MKLLEFEPQIYILFVVSPPRSVGEKVWGLVHARLVCCPWTTVSVIGLLRQGLTMVQKLAWNFQFSCFRAWIIGVCHISQYFYYNEFSL